MIRSPELVHRGEGLAVKAVTKIWGQTRPISGGHGFEVHYLEILERTVCSCHRHATKWNLFYVVSGGIAVHIYDAPGDEPRETIAVMPGHTLQIPPGVWHRFEGLTDSQVIETYWTEPVDPDDIERFDEGRKLPPSDIPSTRQTVTLE